MIGQLFDRLIVADRKMVIMLITHQVVSYLKAGFHIYNRNVRSDHSPAGELYPYIRNDH